MGTPVVSISPRRALVTGAGGFIGHHLVKRLKSEGYWVRGVDLKEPLYEPTAADEFLLADLREEKNCVKATQGVHEVYQLAADMGGIGYITGNHATITRNNVLINTHMVEASRLANVEKYLYTSSACIYPSHLQKDEDVTPLKEADAIPADPERGYGWEKLFAEQLTEYYRDDHKMDVRIVRFHNIYGPLGTYEGGREKSPAAISRKVAEAEPDGTIDIWGDGNQTRSFCYIDDCVEGLRRLMAARYDRPINLGTDEMVTIRELVDQVCKVAGKRLRYTYDLTKPQGVRGRNSDNSLLRSVLGWQPTTTLQKGLAQTYPWIWSQLAMDGRARPPRPAPALSLNGSPTAPLDPSSVRA